MIRLSRVEVGPKRRPLAHLVLFLTVSIFPSYGHARETRTSTKRSPSGAILNVTRNSLCSATLIAPKVLLTAAHCLVEKSGDLVDMQKNHIYFTLSKDASKPKQNNSALVIGFVVHSGYMDTIAAMQEAGEHKETADAYITEAVQTKCGSLLGEDPTTQSLWVSGKLTPQMLREEEAFTACERSILLDFLGPWSSRKGLYDAHDIALVFVDRDIADVQTARLPLDSYESNFVGRSLTVAGYGMRYDPKTHRNVAAGVQSSGTLFFNETSLFEMEASGGDGRVLCLGDSGSGLFDIEADGSFVVVGVGVRAEVQPYSGRCTAPSIATRVAPYVAWIEDTLRGHL